MYQNSTTERQKDDFGGKSSIPTWKRVLFSATLAEKNKSHRVAYVAVMTALVVVANMFFEFKLAETQFSFTLVVCALTGAIIGPLYGALACFLGDLVGFFYNSGGYAYYPWIGISMALVAVIAGLVYALPWRWNGALPVKTTIVAVTTFLLCTVAINTTAFWLIYSKVSYTTYLVSRLFVQGQIWNSLVNYALLFALLPFLRGVKALRLKI